MARNRRDEQSIRENFDAAVNMTGRELESWLKTDESGSVGVAGGERKSGSDGAESVGHESGRRIVTLLDKRQEQLTEDDYVHMRKVIGYVHRHSAQRPSSESVEDSRWGYSLMNWGHDPLKK